MPPFLLPQTFYEPIISAPLHRTMIKTICRDAREIVEGRRPRRPTKFMYGADKYVLTSISDDDII